MIYVTLEHSFRLCILSVSKTRPKSARSSASEKRCLNLVKNAHFPSYCQIKMKILPVGSA